MTIGEAITLIVEKYHDNRTKEWVKDPVAYTLYEVWRISEESKLKYNQTGTEKKELEV